MYPTPIVDDWEVEKAANIERKIRKVEEKGEAIEEGKRKRD